MTISDEAAQEIESRWDKATIPQKLAVFNNLAQRTSGPMHYWREILEIANYYYERRSF